VRPAISIQPFPASHALVPQQPKHPAPSDPSPRASHPLPQDHRHSAIPSSRVTFMRTNPVTPDHGNMSRWRQPPASHFYTAPPRQGRQNHRSAIQSIHLTLQYHISLSTRSGTRSPPIRQPIPTGWRPKAQSWPEARRPTLGTAPTNSQPQPGVASSKPPN
jgi:hypothetical protein